MKTTNTTYINLAKRVVLAFLLLTTAVITHAKTYTNYRTSSAIEVSEENLVVTSTAGQKVMLNVPIKLTTLQCSTTITGQSDNAAFTIRGKLILFLMVVPSSSKIVWHLFIALQGKA